MMEIKTKVDATGMYETTFISLPEQTEQEYRELASKFEKLIKDNEGKIINEEHWGQLKFAYPIGRHHNGYYTFIEFKAPRAFISKLELEFSYDERIIRQLTVSLDKHALAYNEKRRAKDSAATKAENADKTLVKRKRTLTIREEV